MGFFQDIFGRKPVVPTAPELSLPAEQQKAITANVAAAPEAAKLAHLSQEQLLAMAEFAFPGFGAIGDVIGRNLLAGARGEIPSDVATMTRIGTAGQALAGGFGSAAPGSMGSNLEARQLGLTSLGIQHQNLSSVESWLGAMEQLFAPSQALYSGMFITPQQEFASASQERDVQLERNWLAAQIAAMPDPVMRGIHDSIMEQISNYSSYMGGGKGGQQRYSDTNVHWSGGWGGTGAGAGGGAGAGFGFGAGAGGGAGAGAGVAGGFG